MELKNKVMNLYENVLEPVKDRKIVLVLKYVIIDGETDIDKIQKEIPIREVTLRSYIEDDYFMLKYLTQEELEFFRKKMSKIFKKPKIEKLIELVLEKNETDIDKIAAQVPIIIETIRKYAEDKEKLLKYMTEEQVKIFLSRIEPMLRQKDLKIKRLIDVVLIDGLDNLDEIEKKAYIKINTIRKHVEDPKELRKYLKEDELNLFLSKVRKMLADKDQELYKLEVNMIKNIINDILNTRYLYRDIISKNFMREDRVSELLNNKEFMNKEFPVGTYEIIKNKIKENERIRMRTPRNCFVVEDRFFIMILKDDVHYLNQFDNKKINFVSYYLGTGANLDLVMKKFNTSLPETLAILSSPKLQVLLNEWYYNILNHCLKIENILYGNDLNAKKQFIIEITNYLEQNRFDIQSAMTYYQISEPLFNKILNQIIKLPYATEETKQETRNILCIETEKKVK